MPAITEKDEDKLALTQRRAQLIESLAAPLSTEDRVRIQGELSIVNAKIKAINTTTAAQLKAAADRRKVAGMAEAQANASRAWAKVNGTAPEDPEDDVKDDDLGQIEAIDGWIDAALLRHDVEFTRSRVGKLALVGAPPKWERVIGMLVEAVYAAARGQELPDLPAEAARAPKAKPKKR